jgi:hypothetical protein
MVAEKPKKAHPPPAPPPMDYWAEQGQRGGGACLCARPLIEKELPECRRLKAKLSTATAQPHSRPRA